MRITNLLLVTFGLAAMAAAQSVKLRVLERVTTKQHLRLGWELEGKELPDMAYMVRIGKQTLRFFDLDRDGLRADGTDGVALDDFRFVVPLPAEFLLQEGQFRFSFPEYCRLGIERVDLDVEHLHEAATINQIRFANGVAPLRVDLDACRACESHCNHLRLNPRTDMSAHSEAPGTPGYTEAGAKAGRESGISFSTGVADTLRAFECSVWHGEPILSPMMRSFGFASRHGYTMIYPVDWRASERPIFHPARDATDVDPEFASGGEVPNPAPGTDFAMGCGHPIYVRLPAGFSSPLRSVEVVRGKRSRSIDGYTSCPRRPANTAWPTNSDCAVFIPAKPMRSGSLYTATFTFEDDTTYTWSFKTRRR